MNSHMLASNGTLNSAELIPNDKCNWVIHKLDFILNPANTTFSHHNIASIPGSLQHLTFIYREGGHALTSISSFLSHFPNDFAKITYLRWHATNAHGGVMSFPIQIPHTLWLPSHLLTLISGLTPQHCRELGFLLKMHGLPRNSSLDRPRSPKATILDGQSV